VERLKLLRKQRHLSQVGLAIELNMNQNSISRYENGEREADYTALITIADYFDVSIDYLLGRTNNPKINR
jgi:transcriptional regulator with XRE-family HTH domain